MGTSLVSTCVQGKDYEQARRFWDEFAQRGLKPDVISYTTLLNCVHGDDAMAHADAIRAEMRTAQVAPDTFLFNAVLCVAQEAKLFEQFDDVLVEMDSAGVRRNQETERRVRQVSSARLSDEWLQE